MGKVKEPGQPGYDEQQFTGFALRVGINLARRVGWGDGLESALASRFPTAPSDMIQQLRGTLSQGNFAAQSLFASADVSPSGAIESATYGPGNVTGATPAFNLDNIPLVPPTFAPEALGNRIVMTGDTISESADGEPLDAKYHVFGGNEDMDYEDVLDEAINKLYQDRTTTPEAAKPGVIETVINWIAGFVGRFFM